MSNAKLIRREQPTADEILIGLPITSPEALISYGKNFGIEIPLNEKGEVKWEEMKYDYEII